MTTEALSTGFLVSYALTGAALGAVIALGWKRAIRGHLAAIGAFAVGFLVVLYFAENLGRRYAFEPTIERVHLSFAFTATAALVGPLVTGFRRWYGKGSLRAHRIAIVTFLALFVGASATGFMMYASGKPR